MDSEVMVKGWVVVLAVGFPQGRDGLTAALRSQAGCPCRFGCGCAKVLRSQAGCPCHFGCGYGKNCQGVVLAEAMTSARVTGLPPRRLLSSAASMKAKSSRVSAASTGGLEDWKNLMISATSGV